MWKMFVCVLFESALLIQHLLQSVEPQGRTPNNNSGYALTRYP